MSGTEREQELREELEQVRRLLHEERRQFVDDLSGSVEVVEQVRAQLRKALEERDTAAWRRDRLRERVATLTDQRDRARARVARLVERRDELEAEVADSLYRDSRVVRLASRAVRRVRRS